MNLLITQKETDSILFEGEIGTAEYWISKISATIDDISNLQNQLILRKIPGRTSYLRLDFVGLICLRNNAFFALPKIYRDKHFDSLRAAIKTTFSCIQQYQRGSIRTFRATEAGESNIFDGAGTIVDTFISLLAWTAEHGFHHADETFQYDEYSHVNWRETILRTFPVHFGNSVFYGEPLGYRTLPKRSQIAVIQAHALVSLSKFLGSLSEIWLPTYSPLLFAANEIIQDSLLNAWDQKNVRILIEEYLFAANRDYDREILDILNLWINLDHRASRHILLYGTNAFHVVWEDMCISLFDGKKLANHALLASQPVFYCNNLTAEISSQRPDILIEDENFISIADAKWYDFDQGDVPQLGDTIKQIFYEMTIKPSLKVKNNFFLVPGVGGLSWSNVGQIDMLYAQEKDSRFPDISIIRLNWEELALAYTENKIPSWRDELVI